MKIVFTKDWQKASLTSEFLDNAAEHYQVVSLPLISQTLQAVETLTISHAQAKKAKNFYVLGLVLWLFDLSTASCLTFINKKFKANTEIAKANELTLLAGYNYAMTLELSRRQFMLGTGRVVRVVNTGKSRVLRRWLLLWQLLQ